MKILFIGLIIFLTISCASGLSSEEETIRLPWPQKPNQEKVTFEDADGGLYLSHAEYRKLERNIIEMRQYIRELEAQLQFWRREL